MSSAKSCGGPLISKHFERFPRSSTEGDSRGAVCPGSSGGKGGEDLGGQGWGVARRTESLSERTDLLCSRSKVSRPRGWELRTNFIYKRRRGPPGGLCWDRGRQEAAGVYARGSP